MKSFAIVKHLDVINDVILGLLLGLGMPLIGAFGLEAAKEPFQH